MTLTLMTLALALTLSSACSPPVGWKPKTMNQLLGEYDLVVLGTLMDADTFPFPVPNAEKTYELFCVLKGDGKPIPRELTIEDPDNPCVSVKKIIGESFIMGLSRLNDTSFSWWKDAGIEAVQFPYVQENMDNATQICTLQNPTQPVSTQPIPTGSDKTCPVIPENYKDACSTDVPSRDSPDSLRPENNNSSSHNPVRAEFPVLAAVLVASILWNGN